MFSKIKNKRENLDAGIAKLRQACVALPGGDFPFMLCIVRRLKAAGSWLLTTVSTLPFRPIATRGCQALGRLNAGRQ